jgi:hypothetical protein
MDEDVLGIQSVSKTTAGTAAKVDVKEVGDATKPSSRIGC